jgi:hypothetical protein
MAYLGRNVVAHKLEDGFEVSRSNHLITITREPNKADEKYAESYEKRYGVKLRGNNRPVAVQAYSNKIPGCCSGTILSRLSFPPPRDSRTRYGNGKPLSIVKRAELLKLLMKQFTNEAMLLYVCRSDNKDLPKIFSKAGWKKSRGPVGKYSPYNYTLDTYTVDPRTPKRKLPPLPTKKKTVKIEEPKAPVKRYGISVENIKRRIGELRG